MKNENQEIDKLTGELLKKSLLKPASSDFDDKLMERILAAPTPAVPNVLIKKSWFFMGVAIVLFFVSVLVISTIGISYFQNLSPSYSLILNYVLYGGLALFLPLVLYHFDILIQIVFIKKRIETISYSF